MNLESPSPPSMEEGRQSELAERLKNAVETGQTSAVLQLLKMGAPLVIDTDGQTALHLAAAAGHDQVVDALIQAGCDVSIQDFTGHTALQRASAEGHIEIIRQFLKHGVSVDHQDEVHGNTALHEAAWKGYSQSVGILTKVGKANCYMKNRGGFAPLHLCCQNGHNETCRILLLSGCKPDIKNNYGDTPLHTSARYGHAGVVRILVSGKCNPSEQNKNGDTALHIAAAMGRRKLTRVLIESGCSKEIKNKQNETALDIAQRKNLIDIIQILKTVQPPPSSKKDASSPAALNAALSAALEEMSSDVDGIKRAGPIRGENKLRRSSREGTKKRSRRRRHSGGEESAGWSPYGRHYEPDIDNFPPPNLKSLPTDPLKSGEQYFLDLAGNIRKGPVAFGRDCVCTPLIKKMERRLERDKKEIVKKISGTHSKLDSRISHLERKTKDHLFSLNQAMKESFAQERGECLDRMDRRALRERIAIERQQVLRDLSLKRDLAVWLESKLTEIEKKHGLDAKNAALLRTMAMKRFSKYRRSTRKILKSEGFLGSNLRRAHSEELLSEVCADDDEDDYGKRGGDFGGAKKGDRYKGLKVSDRPVKPSAGNGGRTRIRRNSAGDESLLEEETLLNHHRRSHPGNHDDNEDDDEDEDDEDDEEDDENSEPRAIRGNNYYPKTQLDLHSTNSESCNEQSDRSESSNVQRPSDDKSLNPYLDNKNQYENTMMGVKSKEILRPIPTCGGMKPDGTKIPYFQPPPYGHHQRDEVQQYRRELSHVQRQLFPPPPPPPPPTSSSSQQSLPNRSHPQTHSFNSNYPSRSIRPMLAPLDEDDYVGPTEVVGEKEDFHRQLLNIPMTSDGGGSHDSHNDSGYSTRLGFSAGPSPSLSGSRPESSEGDHPHYQNQTAGPPPLLLDPMAINMIPPELELQNPSRSSTVSHRIQEINHQLRMVDLRGATGPSNSRFSSGPKGSLV